MAKTEKVFMTEEQKAIKRLVGYLIKFAKENDFEIVTPSVSADDECVRVIKINLEKDKITFKE